MLLFTDHSAFLANTWPRASVEGPLWNIHATWVLVFAIYICGISCGIWSTKLLQKHIYIYEEYRVAYQIQLISQKHIYIYEEYRVAYPNCIWCFEENSKFYFSRSHIYIWGISCGISKFCKKLKHSSFWRLGGAKSWNIHHFAGSHVCQKLTEIKQTRPASE